VLHTCIDQVGVLLARLGVRSHAQQAVLGLQHHVHAGGDEVTGQGWHSNACTKGRDKSGKINILKNTIAFMKLKSATFLLKQNNTCYR
jgi:hypothetical protein